MTREINGRIRMVVSDDGTRCAAECPQMSGAFPPTCSHWWDPITGPAELDGADYGDGTAKRPPACIAAEQAAASVPSCDTYVCGECRVRMVHPVRDKCGLSCPYRAISKVDP